MSKTTITINKTTSTVEKCEVQAFTFHIKPYWSYPLFDLKIGDSVYVMRPEYKATKHKIKSITKKIYDELIYCYEKDNFVWFCDEIKRSLPSSLNIDEEESFKTKSTWEALSEILLEPVSYEDYLSMFESNIPIVLYLYDLTFILDNDEEVEQDDILIPVEN